jgi:phosphoglycerate dehydrogenase-like enzyme
MMAEIRVLTPMPWLVESAWPGEEQVTVEYAEVERMHELIEGCDVLWTQFFTSQMAERATSLELIQSTGAGIELIDLDAVPPGCEVAIVHEHERAIAEWVLMSMIALNRDAFRVDATFRTGSWEMSYFNAPTAVELTEQTLGIIGFGHIGQQCALLASALGMRVVAATRSPDKVVDPSQFGVSQVVGLGDMAEVLAQSDFVLLATALSAETENLIGAGELAALKSGGSLINVSRARVVDEDALFGALSDGRIKGAALDVWWGEPLAPEETPAPSRHPFGELDNVFMSPHVSAMTQQMLQRRVRSATANIDRCARGEPIQNVVYRG